MRAISEFLDGMRNEGTVKTFTEGYCYWLAVILKERFNGEIMYNPVQGHFCCRVNGELWDITGRIEDDGKWQEWWLYQMNEPLDAERVRKACIIKTRYEEEN